MHPHLLSAFVEGTFTDYLDAAKARRLALMDRTERQLVGFLQVAWERNGLPQSQLAV